MQDSSVEEWLRRFLWVVSVFILIGTIVELLLIEHTEDAVQWVPFLLSGLGIAVLLWFRYKPSQKAITVLRSVMVLIGFGSIFGVYEHLMANYRFSEEIHPAYSFFENLTAAFTGASPMLSPGVLFLTAALALAMTYKHPILEEARNNSTLEYR